jgi:hypothetical protein
VEDEFSTSVADLNATNYKITLEYFKKINPGKSDEYVKQAIYNMAASNKESVDVNSGDVNSFTARFAAKQLQKWGMDPSSVPVEFNDLMSKQNTLTNNTSVQKGRIQKTKDEALNIAKERGLNVPTKDELDKTVKGANISLNNGQLVSLTKEDVLDFANLRPDLFNSLGAMTTDKNQESLANQSLNRLKLKYGNKFNELQNRVYYSPKALPGMGASNQVTSIHPAVEQAGQFLKASNYGKLAAIESEIYLKGGMVKQPVSTPVIRGKENADDRNALISKIIGTK